MGAEAVSATVRGPDFIAAGRLDGRVRASALIARASGASVVPGAPSSGLVAIVGSRARTRRFILDARRSAGPVVASAPLRGGGARCAFAPKDNGGIGLTGRRLNYTERYVLIMPR